MQPRFALVLNMAKDFFTQQLPVRDTGSDRFPLFRDLASGKRVLHIGCCDSPIFNASSNLHLRLAPHAAQLAGCDIDAPGLAILAKHYPGMYFHGIDQVTGDWDIILVPEVVEHVANAGEFLKEIFQLHARSWLITVPHFGYSACSSYDGTTFTEIVHPDHKAWYSPWTLGQAISPFVGNRKVEYLFVSGRVSVGALITDSNV